MKRVVRILTALAMMTIGVLHFVNPAPFVKIVPAALPAPELLVYLSGFFEIAGGAGLLIPRARRWAAWGLIALYVAVFPANINMATNHISFDDAHPIPAAALWIRLPFQILFIAIAYWMTRPDAPEANQASYAAKTGTLGA
jgi:uncharacterized membrane protein